MLGKIDLLLVAFAIVCYLALMYDFYVKQDSYERGKALLERRKRYMDIVSDREDSEKRMREEKSNAEKNNREKELSEKVAIGR